MGAFKNSMYTSEKKRINTTRLSIEYLEWNPDGLRTVVLVHGWPDAARTWNQVAQALAAAGYRALAPSVRGYGGTRFLDATTPRSGELVALGCDLIDFVQALNLHQPALVGHDWGARAVAIAAGLAPRLASHLGMVSVGYGNTTQTSAGKEQWFSGPYRRVVLDGVGHFPQREQPTAVAQALIDFFESRQ